MRVSEWIAAGYFLYLLVPVAVSARSRLARLRLSLSAIGTVVMILAISRLPERQVWGMLRDWAPMAYVLAGYWLPGRLYTAPNERVERWLLEIDAQIFASCSRFGFWPDRAHRAVRAYLELSYLLCYPLVPLAFAAASVAEADSARAADQFWRIVMPAVLVCFGLVPWLPMRPPRALTAPARTARGCIHRVNLLVLRYASIQVNTFPSGHAAAAVASALAVGQVQPLAGVAIGVLAVSIGVASVVGRYHYAADAIVGALVALAAFAALG